MRSAAKAALLIGLGDRKTVSADRIRRAAAAVVRRSPKAKTVATTLLDTVPTGGDRAAAAQAVAEGAALGAYKFLRYKQKSDAPALERRHRGGQEGRPLCSRDSTGASPWAQPWPGPGTSSTNRPGR